jgi:hypothetical protein
MSLAARIFARWVQLSALATAMSLMVYFAAQQVGRQLANDPQIQLAREARDVIAAGAPSESVVPRDQIDIAKSSSPWVQVINDSGRVIASSMRLHGELRTLPRAVFDNVRTYGEERVTWQPESGVRMATVTVLTPGSPGHFVTAGRSLAETEERINKLGKALLIGWLTTIIVLFIVVAASEALLPAKELNYR